MPRICFEHPEIDAWYEKEQEGTSTFDVCNQCCSYEGETAEDIGLEDQGYNDDPIPGDATCQIIDGPLDYYPEELQDLDRDGSPLHYCASCEVGLTEENYYI